MITAKKKLEQGNVKELDRRTALDLGRGRAW